MSTITPTLRAEDLRKFKSSVVKDALLSILTLGFYTFIWQKRKISFVRALVPEADFSYPKWTNLYFQTCATYHIHYEVMIGREIEGIMHSLGLAGPPASLTGADWVICTLTFGLAHDISHQRAINAAVDHLTQESP